MNKERNFKEMLEAKWPETLLCVGLDTDLKKIPEGIDALGFNIGIISETKDLVCAYKPNFAFYEAWAPMGLEVLSDTCEYIRSVAPDVAIIGDCKRGDIGNTNLGYVKAAFDVYGVDAVTVHPYLGQEEGMQVFLDMKDKGIIVLCRTSNKGAREFQDLITLPPNFHPGKRRHMSRNEWLLHLCDEAMPLYQRVAKNVFQNWNMNGNCALVVGATYPKELGEVRKIVGDDMPILIPGVGTQDGDLEQAVKNGINSKGDGIIINSSSGIIYKSTGLDFAEAAREEAKRLRDEINRYRRG